jgi:tRNA(fMet)-specific endonuclease VapC
MKRSHDAVLRRLQKVPIGDVCISVITKSELLYGVELSPRRSQDQAALDAYLLHVQVLEYPDEAALHYAQIRAALKISGTMIGANDLFVAAHARSLGLTLVTNNTREFGRVPVPPDRELDRPDQLRRRSGGAIQRRPGS